MLILPTLLSKALKLFRLSNPPLLEWLSSPLIYRESGPLASLLRDAAPVSTSPIRTWHHYRSLMEKSRARYWDKKPSVISISSNQIGSAA
ncbi:nucleotidyltransferase domain-containing protein [Desulfovibrio sp. OttesenSCG-928-I05]|nr:nucleotidyltransferase domain-containing protein [Desulfovibrio sp. OttesenSCG-928-I05]